MSKTDAAKITKIDVEIFHHESWKPIYFGVKRSKVKVMRHKKAVPAWVLHSLSACECWLVLVFAVYRQDATRMSFFCLIMHQKRLAVGLLRTIWKSLEGMKLTRRHNCC